MAILCGPNPVWRILAAPTPIAAEVDRKTETPADFIYKVLKNESKVVVPITQRLIFPPPQSFTRSGRQKLPELYGGRAAVKQPTVSGEGDQLMKALVFNLPAIVVPKL
jgi:hypothetical protein